VNNLNKISESSFQIIKQPILTDKTIRLTESRKYSFLVSLDSKKSEIKVAIENLFHVKIIKINTCKLPRKKKRVGKFTGWKAQYKKAIVTLSEGETINLFTNS
jgi:large subunit ribosomal protein L23